MNCAICAEPIPDGARSCTLCGTSVPENGVPENGVPTAQVVTPPRTELPPIARLTRAESLTPDMRVCPACGTTYGRDYADAFCTCGMELFRSEQVSALIAAEAPPAPMAAETIADSPGAEKPQAPAKPKGLARPAAGTPCLVLFDADKQPLRYFPLDKDALLIGRLDAVAGSFPDIDVTEWLDAAQARKVSRKHALVMRTRASNAFFLRPLAGNTGTQIDTDMVPPLGDYPLEHNRRIILGGAVRFKFEIT